MAFSTINKSSSFMNSKIFTGTNGSGQAITGVGFQPDMVWIKHRTDVSYHVVTDAVRGVTKYLSTNATGGETTNAQSLTAFGADGFTVGTLGDVDATGNIASWNWKANGAGSANTVGDIASTVSVNTTSGFSIVKYTGTGANATVGHGLGVVPSMMIFKNLSRTIDWVVYSNQLAATDYLVLNSTGAKGTYAPLWNSTAPTSSVFSVGTGNATNYSTENIVAYCFAEVAGYSKFGSYVGNSSTDGTFIYTGFKPSMIIVKGSNESGQDWAIFDDKRDPFNQITQRLQPSSNNAESGGQDIDFLSNGFKPRVNGSYINGAYNYIYMAFGQPIISNSGVCATAR